ncbi:MAG: PIN domain-containing protein [Egibacteraceae bacterium]
MSGTTLDTGALIALESGSRRMIALIETAMRARSPIAVPAGVLAQAWRYGARQARIARLLRSSITELVALDRSEALSVGRLCARTGAADVIDVSVIVCARRRKHQVITGDPDDLAAIDPTLRLLAP